MLYASKQLPAGYNCFYWFPSTFPSSCRAVGALAVGGRGSVNRSAVEPAVVHAPQMVHNVRRAMAAKLILTLWGKHWFTQKVHIGAQNSLMELLVFNNTLKPVWIWIYDENYTDIYYDVTLLGHLLLHLYCFVLFCFVKLRPLHFTFHCGTYLCLSVCESRSPRTREHAGAVFFHNTKPPTSKCPFEKWPSAAFHRESIWSLYLWGDETCFWVPEWSLSGGCNSSSS